MRRARIVGAIAAAGVGAVLLRPRAAVDAQVVAEMTAPQPTVVAVAPRPPTRRVPRPPVPGAAVIPQPVSVQDLLEHGSAEPLEPLDLDLGEAPLADGREITSEPLVPRDLDLGEVPLAPGSEASTEPLVPREIVVPAEPQR